MIRPLVCPICDRDLPLDPHVRSQLFPFCSVRCRQIDLYRWTQGRYAIVEPLDPESIDPRTFDPESFDPDADGPERR